MNAIYLVNVKKENNPHLDIVIDTLPYNLLPTH